MIEIFCNTGSIYMFEPEEIFPKVNHKFISQINENHDKRLIVVAGVAVPAQQTSEVIWDSFEHTQVNDDLVIRAWSQFAEVYVDAPKNLCFFTSYHDNSQRVQFHLGGSERVLIGAFDPVPDDLRMFEQALRQPLRRGHEAF